MRQLKRNRLVTTLIMFSQMWKSQNKTWLTQHSFSHINTESRNVYSHGSILGLSYSPDPSLSLVLTSLSLNPGCCWILSRSLVWKKNFTKTVRQNLKRKAWVQGYTLPLPIKGLETKLKKLVACNILKAICVPQIISHLHAVKYRLTVKQQLSNDTYVELQNKVIRTIIH